jgi:hypothetical protein
MKQKIKMAMPSYFVILSVFFSVCIILIKKAATWNSIGVILDCNFALLAIIIFSNTFYVERQLHTLDVYSLAPRKKVEADILNRVVIKTAFLFLLFILTYLVYIVRRPDIYMGESKVNIFLNAIFAGWSSILFWGALSLLLVNLFSNLWIGVCTTVLLWGIMTSTIARKVPVFIDVFRYGNLDINGIQLPNWQLGKIVCLISGIVFIWLNTYLIKRRPYK